MHLLTMLGRCREKWQAGSVMVVVTASAEGKQGERKEEREQKQDGVRYRASTSIAGVSLDG